MRPSATMNYLAYSLTNDILPVFFCCLQGGIIGLDNYSIGSDYQEGIFNAVEDPFPRTRMPCGCWSTVAIGGYDVLRLSMYVRIVFIVHGRVCKGRLHGKFTVENPYHIVSCLPCNAQ